MENGKNERSNLFFMFMMHKEKSKKQKSKKQKKKKRLKLRQGTFRLAVRKNFQMAGI